MKPIAIEAAQTTQESLPTVAATAPMENRTSGGTPLATQKAPGPVDAALEARAFRRARGRFGGALMPTPLQFRGVRPSMSATVRK